ncbi:MAG: VTT domain-containing protein [Burkholderiaceae bacterium]|nr:VTT domain-containing protein [Burkholderiaceae bacterium]
MQLLDLILHVDKYLGEVIKNYGGLVYLLLGTIIFCETGVVVLFFLPGDTLLFVGGAFCAGGAINVLWLVPLLMLAAIGGSTFNYWLGSAIGHRVYTHNYRWLDRQALMKTHAFYEKYGGFTMLIARFVPVVRTFAPFVAGVSEMTWTKFQVFSTAGVVVWVSVLISCGYFFGNIPILRDHLNTIVLVGVSAAVVPVVLAALWRTAKKIMRR